MIDDEGNILSDSDVSYILDEITDEYGNKKITKRPYIKTRTKRPDDTNTTLFSQDIPDHVKVKKAIVIDPMGNKAIDDKIVLDDDY
jgi:hypothetical protein